MSRLSTRRRPPELIHEMKVSLPPAGKAECVSVQEGYERWAQSYDHTPNPLLALEERHLKRILPNLAGGHLLDLGCGTGRWLRWFCAHTVVGIDLSAAMLKVARGKVGIRHRLVRADCLHLPFRAAVFDFALSSFALNHINDLQTMAFELARVMKFKGQLLICEMHPEAYSRGWRPGFRDEVSAAQIESVSYSAESVISSFRSNGFSCLKSYDLFFGEPERPIFLNAGRGEMFANACQVPAIQVYEFTHMDSATGLE